VGLISRARDSGKYCLYNPEMLKVLKRFKYLRDVERLNVPAIKRELSNGYGPCTHTVQLNGIPTSGQVAQVMKRLGPGCDKGCEVGPNFPGFLSAIELALANPRWRRSSARLLHTRPLSWNSPVSPR
jgi:hypothetical protein